MDIATINELLKENEQIKRKVGELKRKLNLKNYTEKQKTELRCLIEKLKDVYITNQSICANLSEIKADTFARMMCNILNKKQSKYRVCCASLNFSQDTNEYSILKHYKNQTKGKFLVVTNREILTSDEVSLSDISLIPIVYMKDIFGSNRIDEYDLAILENQKITLFDNPDFDNIDHHFLNVKTFNLGKAGEKNYTKNEITELKNRIKAELGIYSKELESNKEKQL